jgi:hypothetical protein
MVRAIDYTSQLTGDGDEKYNPSQKRGPGDFDEELDKRITEREAAKNQKVIETNKAKFEVGQIADQVKAARAADSAYTKNFTGNTRGGGGGSTGGGGGGMGINGKLSNRDLTRAMKAGGKVLSASSRADGCATKGKTKGRFV